MLFYILKHFLKPMIYSIVDNLVFEKIVLVKPHLYVS